MEINKIQQDCIDIDELIVSLILFSTIVLNQFLEPIKWFLSLLENTVHFILYIYLIVSDFTDFIR